MAKPRIGITVGDPAGIGPEIAVKAAADPAIREICEPVLYGPHDGAALDTNIDISSINVPRELFVGLDRNRQMGNRVADQRAGNVPVHRGDEFQIFRIKEAERAGEVQPVASGG